jgi:uncharacterized protein
MIESALAPVFVARRTRARSANIDRDSRAGSAGATTRRRGIQVARLTNHFVAFALGVAAAGAAAADASGAATPETRAAASPGVPFDRTLELKGISFRVASPNAGSVNELTIRPAGLEIDNSPKSHEVDGAVTAAEVADLNGDGSPEIYVYVTSAGSGSYGSLVAYSSNRRKSMSPIYLPPLTDDPRASRGYMGHDGFAVVDGVLRRRFPVYRSGDTNARPTGGVRELDYRLVAGEAGWILRLVRTVDRAGAAASAGPSFDCASAAAGSIEAQVCTDEGLSALDRRLAQVYAAARKKATNEHPPVLRAEQRGWIKGRNDCWKAEDRRLCVETAYVRRIAELQARYRLVEATGPVFYACDGEMRNEVVATFFSTDPPTLIAERGDQVSLMYLQPSGSGAKYQGRNESLWEHQGEARITWGHDAPEMRCTKN